MIKKILIIFALLFLAGCTTTSSKVCFKESCFDAEIADSAIERREGLMFREQMGDNQGMLFVFEKEGIYPFWMKDTLIPLDMIWLNSNKEVVFIKNNAPPCGNETCLDINPGKNALYVLEINGGLAEKNGIKIGDKLDFN